MTLPAGMCRRRFRGGFSTRDRGFGMEMFLYGAVFGFAAGFVLAYVARRRRSKAARELAEELFRETENLRREESNVILERVRAVFSELSLETLDKTTEQLMKRVRDKFEDERTLHKSVLDSDRKLIDRQLERMSSELEKVRNIISEFERDREKKFGELAKQLEETGRRTGELIQSTNTLREALAGTKTRGQWGERMAEDILRLAGFIENVNYVKQKAIKGTGEIPDFTFFLPRGLVLNMDVKFPYDNYIRYLDSESEAERESFGRSFLRDVRNRIQEVASRGYINPEQNTVDFVLLFIPNEHIFAFIHEHDGSLIDESIRKKVIMCSPVTLFSVLAVIRAAVDNFALEQTSNRILSLLGTFKKQWEKFVDSFDSLGKRIEAVQKEYENLVGTRRRQLDRPLNEIDGLRERRGIRAELNEGEILPEAPGEGEP